jgi:hypothetical protein
VLVVAVVASSGAVITTAAALLRQAARPPSWWWNITSNASALALTGLANRAAADNGITYGWHSRTISVEDI